MLAKRTKDGAFAERVVRAILGAPSGRDETTVRFADIGVNVTTGYVYDYDDEQGFSAVEFIQKVKDLSPADADTWIKLNVVNAKPDRLDPELEGERLLIGLLSLQPALIAHIQEDVTPENFLALQHRQMFQAVFDAYVADKPATLKTLLDACGGDPLEPVFGGYTLVAYVAKLMADSPQAPDAAHLARQLASELRSRSNAEAGLYDEYDREPVVEPEPFVSKFGGIMFEQLDEPGPEHEDIIDGWLTVGDTSVLGGESRSGKSFLAIHMAMCIATASKFYGREVLRPGLVIYQAGEGQRGIKKRFRAWRQAFKIPAGIVPVFILQSTVDIYSQNGDTAKLIEEIKGIESIYNMPVVALFIDTLAKASGAADENSGTDLGLVMGNIDRISQAIPGAHICLVHHMNAGGTKLRGHTSVYANSDQVILVKREEGTKVKIATLDKQKDGEDGIDIRFETVQVELGYRETDGKPITSCITLPAGASVEIKGAGKDRSLVLSDQQQLAFDALKSAIEEHGEPTPAVLRLPKSITYVVNVAHWKQAYRAVASNVEENSVNQALKRASEKFLRLRIVGRVNPYIWLTGRTVAGLRDQAPANRDATKGMQQEIPDHALDFSPR